MQEGDIIAMLGNSKISSTSDYEMMMRSFASGEKIDLLILRGGKNIELIVRASVFPEKLAMKLAYRLIGVKVVEIEEKKRFRHRVIASSGVIIEEIDKHSALAKINVRPGDVIRQMDEITIRDIADFKKAIIKYRWKESVVILLQRGDSGYYITLQL